MTRHSVKARNATPNSIEACCPNCDNWQRVDRDEDGAPDLDTNPCHADGCTKRLCQYCDQFRCENCGLDHCAEHRTWIEGMAICPVCKPLVLADLAQDPEPCECVYIDVDLVDAWNCPTHGPNKRSN